MSLTLPWEIINGLDEHLANLFHSAKASKKVQEQQYHTKHMRLPYIISFPQPLLCEDQAFPRAH